MVSAHVGTIGDAQVRNLFFKIIDIYSFHKFLFNSNFKIVKRNSKTLSNQALAIFYFSLFSYASLLIDCVIPFFFVFFSSFSIL